jgi:putative ABC transport system permease protein
MAMSGAERTLYRWLSRLLPGELRTGAGADLAAMAEACLARERARLGRAGFALAWIRLIADTVAVAAAAHISGSPTPHHFKTPQRGVLEANMDMLRRDIVFALRTLRRQPGFALITLLTLTLGIGANTAIFSVVNGVLLQPLPYPHPEQLEFISSQFPNLGFDQFWVDPGEYVDFRTHQAAYTSIGAYGTTTVTMGGDSPSRPLAGLTTPDLMPTLGVAPEVGRWFNDQDARPGAEAVIILSHELWQRQFGGDRSAVGRNVMVGTSSTRVVGVMPPGFDVHDEKIEVWLPLTIDPAQLNNSRGSHFLHIIGRRKPDVTEAGARSDLERMLTQWANYAPAGAHVPNTTREGQTAHRLRLDPLKDDIVGNVRLALVMLQGAVAFVLLIACVNLANLLLARADSRHREFAVRTALGAGRGRLLRQFVVEGLVLTLAAAALGTLGAWLVVHGLVVLNPDAIPRASNIALDGRVLLFTLALALGTGVIFGAVPLLHLSQRMALSLRDGTRTAGGASQQRLRGALVIAEVALAVMLVVGAGLLVRSFVNLMKVDTGFNRAQLVTFDVVAPVITGLPQDQRVAQRVRIVGFMNEICAKLGALPGVKTAAGMTGLPPNRPVNANDTLFEWIPQIPRGQPSPYPTQNVDFYQTVTLGYTETMGIPVMKGRTFTQSDAGGSPVVLVNEALARRFFTDFGRDPIGQHIKPFYNLPGQDSPWFTVIGVLKDVKQRGVDAPVGTELYALQDQMPKWGGLAVADMNFVVRAATSLGALAQPIRQMVHDLDARAPVVKMQTMDDVFGEAVARPKFLTWLLGIFALLALTLAAVGTYGILSYVVTARHQEIGVRMALGANPQMILRLFLGQGLILAVVGLAIGLAGSIALRHVIATLLFNVTATDPATLALVSTVIFVVAAAAVFIPSWRATRVDPLTVLRDS